jgi:hypothetical protein
MITIPAIAEKRRQNGQKNDIARKVIRGVIIPCPENFGRFVVAEMAPSP